MIVRSGVAGRNVTDRGRRQSARPVDLTADTYCEHGFYTPVDREFRPVGRASDGTIRWALVDIAGRGRCPHGGRTSWTI